MIFPCPHASRASLAGVPLLIFELLCQPATTLLTACATGTDDSVAVGSVFGSGTFVLET